MTTFSRERMKMLYARFERVYVVDGRDGVSAANKRACVTGKQETRSPDVVWKLSDVRPLISNGLFPRLRCRMMFPTCVYATGTRVFRIEKGYK